MENKIDAGAKSDAGIGVAAGLSEAMRAPRMRYEFECRDREGRLVWRDAFENLVTTEGKNDLLTQYFKGSGYNAAFYVGLIDATGYNAVAAGDTAAKITGSTPNAPTTNDWAELSEYDESVRQTLTLGTASAGSIDNSASKAVFTMNATKTVKGAFVATSSTKDGTSGKLYCAGAFSSDKPVAAGYTLSVTQTLTA